MNIIIVDDDLLVSMSLKTILEADGEVQVLALGKDGNEAIELYNKYNPDVMLMDIRMDGMSGLDACKAIMQSHLDAKILLLTTFSDDEYIVKAIHYGAKGYILKQDYASIVSSLMAVYNGQTVFGDEIMEKLPSLIANGTELDYKEFDINDKEFEIVQLVADGLNNKEIAEKLYLSEGTVRNYISNILDKLNLRDRTQLACFYYKNF